MSSIPANPAEPQPPAAAAPRGASARLPGGHCGNCGFEDTGYYCSRCGEPLHGTRDTVLQIVWSDLVEGPIHNLFALIKTTWLILIRPRRFFDGVLRRQHGMTHVPFFLAPAWRRVSHKPHGVPNAVKYFVLIYTLTLLGAWAAGVNVVPPIPIPFRRDAVLPGTFAEPLILMFVVFAAYLYSATMSRLLNKKIATELLTRFMLYLNGFALIPFVGMAVFRRTPWALVLCVLLWLYALFALPQVSLPHLFRISRWRLGFAQAGAAVANLVLAVVMVFCAGVLADVLLPPGWATGTPTAAAQAQPFDPAEAGFSAVRRARGNVFVLDSVAMMIPTPHAEPPKKTHPARHR